MTEPELGALEITIATSGPEPDPDGYAVSIDGATPEAVAIDGVLRREQIALGAHTVDLSGVSANCAVAGEARRSVSVAAGAIATTAYSITCAPTTGAIEITTSTGEPADADGYQLLLDGAEVGPIAATATVTVPDLAPGPHTVSLSGVAANCRVEGDNPTPVTVVAGATVAIAFTIACDPLPPASAAILLTTATSGPSPDPDGYRFRIDGGDPRPVGGNATVTVTGLTPGDHVVDLGDVAPNCVVGGDNPRSVSLPDGGTVPVDFSVTCAAVTGSLKVDITTSGAPADPNGYTVRVDAGTARRVAATASVAFDGLQPGTHAVALGDLAANCTVEGENPRSIPVGPGETAVATFAIGCAAITGSLAVTIEGLPAGTNAAVRVAGPDGFSRQVNATRTLADLEPGEYTVTATDVTGDGTRYTPSPADQTETVTAGETAAVKVTYAAADDPTLNLRIEGWHLTQSVQTPDNDIPMVGNRDGYLRVFVVATESNRVAPAVRVRLYRDGIVTSILTIPPPGASTPTTRDEGRLGSSWNVRIPRTAIGPGFALLAEVDPDGVIPELNESDNSYPLSGTPEAPEVRSAPVLGLRFVPVKQKANGLQGDVTADNKARFLELSRKLYPLPGADGDLHAVYTTTTSDPLQPDNANGAWVTVLSELDAMRLAEGTSRHYYGVVRIGYLTGIAGIGFLGLPTAMGYDDAFDRSRVMAHELGHTWDRLHTPCGGPIDVDPAYPYPGGEIGVYGMDMGNEVLKEPGHPDIMGYCGDPWISDYTYRAVMEYRGKAASLRAPAAARAQRCLLVWGRIVGGRPVLEPAFEVVTRPRLPEGSGPYAIEAHGADGALLFSFSFDAAPVADDPRGSRHFAFAVPLSESSSARLGSLRLAAPAGATEAARPVTPRAAVTPADSIRARRVAGGVALQWNPATHPMILVRDPDTGEVLSFARGGQVEITTDKANLDLVVSDRVSSRRLRVPVETR